MPSYRTLAVAEILAARAGLQRVLLADGSRAYNLVQLTGPVAVADEVVVNTTAVEMGLGTGGWHVVHWNLAHRDLPSTGGGHIMKMRYTSLQADVSSYGEQEWRDEGTAGDGIGGDGTGGDGDELAGVPVVVCSLHSQMAVVAAAFAEAAPGRRMAYVMTDGAALPLVLSDLVADLCERGLLCATVTSGHAFGGDVEAVSVAAALVAARRVGRADAIVVAMGPGVVGTGTTLDTTALEVGPILDIVGALGGTPVVCVRASDSDPRDRHRGLSHHTRTVLERFVQVRVRVPVPAGLDPEAMSMIAARHDVSVEVIPNPTALLAGHRLSVTTMGRSPAQDPLFFACAVAAGTLAGRILSL